jgi:hypothetical protein
MNTMQWQQLASRAADGTLSQEEGTQLLVLCRESHEAREALTKVMAVERLLPLALGDPRGTLAAKEVVLRLEEGKESTDQSIEIAWRAAEKARSWLWGKRLRQITGVAAAVALLGVAVWWSVEFSRPAVSYSRSEALTWAGRPPVTDSQGLARGTRLQASAGLLELGFSSGARMVLEAPFDVELRDGLTAYLHSGRVTVRCPSTAHGFTVLTPYGKIVDRGTEFCVDLNRKTRNMEVHVLEGMVEATVPHQVPVSLFAGDALRISGQNTKRLQANEGAFITALPTASDDPAHFVHWGFNEAGGWVAGNQGNGLGRTDDTKLYLRGHPNPDIPGEGTQWIRGPFGHAMSLDGRSGYAETPFPGIAGNAARTVALWVRVPKNFDPNQGHGIVSWGTLQRGGAWQLSANGIAADGPLGRLRVGTYQTGAMVGTTDLRDGNWHHVAVVMYGGARPTEAVKNMLFYVDGRPEPIARRSLREVDTDVANAHHGIWIGRNVSYPLLSKTTNSSGMFFRGEVDEVYVFDSALSHQSIQRLMKENEPPP